MSLNNDLKDSIKKSLSNKISDKTIIEEKSKIYNKDFTSFLLEEKDLIFGCYLTVINILNHKIINTKNRNFNILLFIDEETTEDDLYFIKKKYLKINNKKYKFDINNLIYLIIV